MLCNIGVIAVFVEGSVRFLFSFSLFVCFSPPLFRSILIYSFALLIFNKTGSLRIFGLQSVIGALLDWYSIRINKNVCCLCMSISVYVCHLFTCPAVISLLLKELGYDLRKLDRKLLVGLLGPNIAESILIFFCTLFVRILLIRLHRR